ncbi:MAG: cell wall hydrolase [Brevundimonas sp.]|nr:cell wall hydrolase [Brevundimonas sp.]
MIRPTLIAAAAVVLAAAPVLAQTAPPPADAEPGSEAWLRQRGEMYRRAPDSEQDPAEVAATARLNAEIAARNSAAAETDAEAAVSFEQRNAEWRAETARLETERAQWEANASAANAAQARWERDLAAWEAEVAACRRAGRVCITPPPPRP